MKIATRLRLDDPRDVRDFVEAKRRKGEPILVHASASGSSFVEPRSAGAFAAWRAGLRASGSPLAADKLDALGAAHFRRHLAHLPTPRRCGQNSDSSITLFWGKDILVRIWPEGVAVLLGAPGPDCIKRDRIDNDLLDRLQFQTRMKA